MSARSSATSALRLTFSVFTSAISVFISPNAVFVSLIVLPTSIISPFSFPTRSFSRHCTSLQNSKSASVLTRCVLICNSRPLLPQVLTLKTPSAYSVLHCPRRIPPNPAGGGFAGSSGCGSASSARAVFAQHNAHARRSKKKTILVFPRSSRLKISLFSTIQLYKDLFCVRANELTSVVVKYRPLTRRRRHRPRENGGGKKR